MRATTCSLLFASLLSCSSNDSSAPGIEKNVALARAADCSALEKAVQDTAVRQMRAQVDALLDPDTGRILVGAGAPAAAAAEPASYSTTHVQVAGVDEGDFVKNDGTRIFVLAGRRLYAAKSWPPADLSVAGKLDLEGWPQAMFLDGNQLVVISVNWTVPDGGSMGGAARPVCNMLSGTGCFWGWSTTKLTVVDVTSLAAPTVKSELYLPGAMVSSRRIGSSVRVVLSDGVRWPASLEWMPSGTTAAGQNTDASSALKNVNEAIIRGTPLAQWFPPPQRQLDGGGTADVAYQCSDFFLTNAPERLGLVTIATLDLANLDAGVSRTSIVGEAGIVYASEKRLYLANPHWWAEPGSGQRDYTYVHAFDLSDSAGAAYVGSGGVEGHVADSYSLDEHDGYLRVATTQSRWDSDPAFPGSWHTGLTSRLTVLGVKGETLQVVGEIAPLEDNEAVTAARFEGDKGYAATFRSVDPLVTLDLSDPAHPRKVADLTVPGFSTYLQPIDGTHLLALGSEVALDGAGNPDWTKRALSISLFDVSDLAHPVRSAQVTVGTAAASSEAAWDHRAFNWYRPDPAKPGLLAIPFSDWTPLAQNWETGFVSDVRVFSVDPVAGVSPLGALGMSDVYLQQGSGAWTWWYRPWVRRSVLATDDAGNTFVYAVSDAGVRVAPLSTLSAPVGTALFPRIAY